MYRYACREVCLFCCVPTDGVLSNWSTRCGVSHRRPEHALPLRWWWHMQYVDCCCAFAYSRDLSKINIRGDFRNFWRLHPTQAHTPLNPPSTLQTVRCCTQLSVRENFTTARSPIAYLLLCAITKRFWNFKYCTVWNTNFSEAVETFLFWIRSASMFSRAFAGSDTSEYEQFSPCTQAGSMRVCGGSNTYNGVYIPRGVNVRTVLRCGLFSMIFFLLYNFYSLSKPFI